MIYELRRRNNKQYVAVCHYNYGMLYDIKTIHFKFPCTLFTTVYNHTWVIWNEWEQKRMSSRVCCRFDKISYVLKLSLKLVFQQLRNYIFRYTYSSVMIDCEWPIGLPFLFFPNISADVLTFLMIGNPRKADPSFQYILEQKLHPFHSEELRSVAIIIISSATDGRTFIDPGTGPKHQTLKKYLFLEI